MPLSKFTGATNTIQSLSDRPNQNDGLTASGLKIKFDQFAIDSKAYYNDVMTVEIDASLLNANTNATNAVNTANTSNTNASNAVTTANTASSTASTALSTANTASTNASTALSTANTALSTANDANDTAVAVETDYNLVKPTLLQAVADVALKVDLAYVDQVALNYQNGIMLDGSIENKKLDKNIKQYDYEGKRFIVNNPYKDGGSLKLKGQMHCHTTNSDGTDTPTNLVTAYKNAGYDFITITDHNYVTSDPVVSGITWIGNSVEDSKDRHIVAYNISTMSNLNNYQDIIDYYKSTNNLVSLPHVKAITGRFSSDNEVLELQNFNFVEVYNGVLDLHGEHEWDILLSEGRKVFALSTDDCHNPAIPAQFNKGWVVVTTNTNNKVSILESLTKGNFYASNGNDISVSLNTNTITASSVALSNFSFIGFNGEILQTNNGVTSANYTIVGDEVYVRVKSIKVSDSTLAWSNPIFIDVVGKNDKIKPISFDNNYNHVINGNFDVWQSGTTFTNPGQFVYTADMFRVAQNVDGGVFPTTITHSRQILDSGILPNAYYHYRISVNGAGSGFGTNASYYIQHIITDGTKKLCGENEKVTLSFWAKSDIANKKLAFNLSQYYGTGGSPSAIETLKGTYLSLRNEWTHYSFTFNTNTLKTKVFGTNNDDALIINLFSMWGATKGDISFDHNVSESFLGSGNIDIDKIELFTGNKALATNARSFTEELRLCERYYRKSYDYNVVPGTATSNGASLSLNGADTTTFKFSSVSFDTMRATPIVTIYDELGAVNKLSAVKADGTSTHGVTATTSGVGDSGFRVYLNGVSCAGILFQHTEDARIY